MNIDKHQRVANGVPSSGQRAEARKQLGSAAEDFVVGLPHPQNCSICLRTIWLAP